MDRPKPRIEIPAEIEAEMTPAVKAFVVDAFAQLEERIRQLEDEVRKLTPRNSSVPPSSEHPHAKPKRKPRPGKKRKPGGQQGHKRNVRELIPSEQCTAVIPVQPTGCRRCGGELSAGEAKPIRHQVWEPVDCRGETPTPI